MWQIIRHFRRHRRKAHPAVYQAEMESKDGRRRVPVSRLEAYEVAKAEVEHQGSTPINKHLAARLRRPIDDIRKMRKQREYLEIRFRLEREHEAMETPLPDNDAPLASLHADAFPSQRGAAPAPSRAEQPPVFHPVGPPPSPGGSPEPHGSSLPARTPSPNGARPLSEPALPSSPSPDPAASPPSDSPDLPPVGAEEDALTR